jgi:hypothetical protein
MLLNVAIRVIQLSQPHKGLMLSLFIMVLQFLDIYNYLPEILPHEFLPEGQSFYEIEKYTN